MDDDIANVCRMLLYSIITIPESSFSQKRKYEPFYPALTYLRKAKNVGIEMTT